MNDMFGTELEKEELFISNFKPTWLTMLLVIVLTSILTTFAHQIWIFIYPILVYLPFSIAVIIFSLCVMVLKKYSFAKKYRALEAQSRLLIEAEQIEAISNSSTVELFPDIQVELLKAAASKYSELGDLDKATELQTKAIALG